MTTSPTKTAAHLTVSSHDSTIATASPPVATTPTKTPSTALGAGLLPLPPDVTIPSPPQGYEPTTGVNFRGIIPWTAELVLLPKVLKDLARFTSYASVLGSTAPPLAQIIEALTVGAAWSVMRSASAAWDAYCRDQEGSAWRFINGIMDRLRPAFALAVKADASLASTYPSLAKLLGIKKANALKGAATRQRNKQAAAEGKPATHGAVGKAREKRAAKAALAAANGPASAPSPAPTPALQEGVATSAPVTPSAASAAPAAPKAPVVGQ